ncbi:hypothetical protein INT48_005058 [Thamnidium elegans]|uniref:Uncharacterized protein n=1 Tax=Thamnidium elegans TaxID=101142 RepID=A0A8H7SNA3_9FUNG|nr:hypothetical protein INT48_005058 [Thamnidium elegans]
MGNTASTTSRKHQKRAAPRKVKHSKKSPATTNNTMRGIKAMMTPATTKKAPRKRTKKPVKKNDTSSMVKRYGPVAWSKAKASGVGPFKNKRAPPSTKAGLFSKFAANKLKH